MNESVLIALCVFASIGILSTAVGVWKFLRYVRSVLVNLNTTLREAVDLMRLYKGDFEVLRQVQEAASPNFGPTMEDAVRSAGPQRSVIPPFPTPVYERFHAEKPHEEDAPPEDVEVSPLEKDLIEVEQVEDMRRMGYETEDPMATPPGRTVDAS